MSRLQKILHVDDDNDICTIVKIALETVGDMTVEQCNSGREAVEKAPVFRPHLFLLDVMMPEMGGEETLLELRKLPGMENIPAIFITAKAEASVSSALLEKGAIAVIKKPFDPMRLCAELVSAWQVSQNAD